MRAHERHLTATPTDTPFVKFWAAVSDECRARGLLEPGIATATVMFNATMRRAARDRSSMGERREEMPGQHRSVTPDQEEVAGAGLQMKYFVLKPKGGDRYAAASRKAMRAYADHIAEENPELSKQLRDWADFEGSRAYDASVS